MKRNVFDIAEFEPHGSCHVTSSIISGIGSIASGLIGSSASKSASSAQTSAISSAIDMLKSMFSTVEGYASPFISAGSNTLSALESWLNPSNKQSGLGSALNLAQTGADYWTNTNTGPLASLIKLTTPGSDMSSTLEQTPGYNFTKTMGLKAVDNSLAARGLAGPGGALSRGAADYVTGLSESTWKDVVNALTNTISTGTSTTNSFVNQLLNSFSTGATGLQNLVNTGTTALSSLGSTASNMGNTLTNAYTSLGNASASGTLGSANSISNAVTGAANSASSYSLLSKLLGSGSGGSLYGSSSSGNYGGTNGVFGGSSNAIY